jgi:hypothetical protein
MENLYRRVKEVHQ